MLPNQIKQVVVQILKPFSLYKRSWLFFMCLIILTQASLVQATSVFVTSLPSKNGNEGELITYSLTTRYSEPLTVRIDAAPSGAQLYVAKDINRDGVFDEIDVKIIYYYIYGGGSEDEDFQNFNVGPIELILMDAYPDGVIDESDYDIFSLDLVILDSNQRSFKLIWTPGYSDSGTRRVQVSAVDSRGNVVEGKVFYLIIANSEQAPIVQDINQQEVKAGNLAMFVIDAQPVGRLPSTRLTVFSNNLPPNAVFYKVGDMNFDGDLTLADKDLLQLMALDGPQTPLERLIGNVDNDQAGGVTQADALYLLKVLEGKVPTINRYVFYWPTDLNFVAEQNINISVQDPVNSFVTTKSVKINPINELFLDQPIRNLYLGVSTYYPTLYQPQTIVSVENKTVEIERWTGFLRLSSGKTYPLTVEGPVTIAPNGRAELKIKSTGCRYSGNCVDYPDLDFMSVRNMGLEMIIQYKVKGVSNLRTLKNSAYAFNARNHKSMYSYLVDPTYLGLPRTTEFSSFKTRVKLNKLSRTYFAVFNFASKGGYAGVSYSPNEARFDYKMSLWNGCTSLEITAENYCYRNNQDYRSQFVYVNSAAGVTMYRKPEGDFKDNNFTTIRNSSLGWDINKEYSFQLEVRDSKSAFTVINYETGKSKIINRNNEFWTQYTFYRIEHDASGDVLKDKTIKLGTIAKFGSYKFNGINSFMEAFGADLNFQPQEMEIVKVEARVTGETQWRTINTAQILTNAGEFINSGYPGASWLDINNRLHLSTGGQTPHSVR